VLRDNTLITYNDVYIAVKGFLKKHRFEQTPQLECSYPYRSMPVLKPIDEIQNTVSHEKQLVRMIIDKIRSGESLESIEKIIRGE